jgi:hypothetical protein
MRNLPLAWSNLFQASPSQRPPAIALDVPIRHSSIGHACLDSCETKDRIQMHVSNYDKI